MTIVAGNNDEQYCCEGVLVEVSGDQLTSMCSEGEEHHYTVARDAMITCEGKAGQLSDLKEGSPIRMKMCDDDSTRITAIESGRHIAAPSEL